MTIALEFQGSVVAAVNVIHKPQPPRAIAKRGMVNGFSKASRRRMVDFSARLDLRAKKVVFLTLTFSGNPDKKEAKRALKAFLMRLRRFCPQASGIWRMEDQKRGAPHFHLMLFNLPYIPQRSVQRAWERCTREVMSRVDIRMARGLKQVMSYVSKYIAKVDEGDASGSLVNASYQHGEGEPWQGRVWGWLHKEGLPIAERFTIVLRDQRTSAYFWWGCRCLSRGRSGYRKYSAKLYTPDAQEIFTWLASWGGQAGWEWLQEHEHLKRYPDDIYFRMQHFLQPI